LVNVLAVFIIRIGQFTKLTESWFLFAPVNMCLNQRFLKFLVAVKAFFLNMFLHVFIFLFFIIELLTYFAFDSVSPAVCLVEM